MTVDHDSFMWHMDEISLAWMSAALRTEYTEGKRITKPTVVHMYVLALHATISAHAFCGGLVLEPEVSFNNGAYVPQNVETLKATPVLSVDADSVYLNCI